MQLRVVAEDVATAAARTRLEASACRGLATATAQIGGVSAHEVAAGLSELVDVCADAMELVALDLELIASRMDAGARLYAAVERAAAGRLRLQGP